MFIINFEKYLELADENEKIKIDLSSYYLGINLSINQNYALIPDDLTVEFNARYLMAALEILVNYPSTRNVDFDVDVTSDDEDLGEGDETLIFTRYDIYAEFTDDGSCTTYSVPLFEKLEIMLTTKRLFERYGSPYKLLTAERPEVEYEILVQGMFTRTANVPFTVFHQGQEAIEEWLKTHIRLNEKFDKDDLECVIELASD